MMLNFTVPYKDLLYGNNDSYCTNNISIKDDCQERSRSNDAKCVSDDCSRKN